MKLHIRNATTLAALWIGILVPPSASAQTVQNGSFETPSVGTGWQYQPPGASWDFYNNSGIVGRSPDWGSPIAPDGVQVALLQSAEGTNPEISQAISGFSVGQRYQVSFAASQRVLAPRKDQDFNVLVDNTLIGHFQPAGGSFEDFITTPFTATSITHTLRFVGLNSAANSDATAFIDNVSVSSASAPLVVLAESHFDDINVAVDGWQGTNDASGPETLTYAIGGATSNSVGYIYVSETAGDGSTMYLVAPAKFRGDQHAAYNGFLKFNLKQSATSNTDGAGNFVLLGSSDVLLAFTLRTVPPRTWTFYEVPLNENVGWFNVTSNRLATQDDFHAVLKAVTRLWIRGEYSYNNFDETDLDDVQLLAQPSGPSQPTLSLASYAGISISGQVGASYRIEFRGSMDATNDWQKLAELVLPVSPYLFFDTNSPSSSQRFYRAVLMP